VSPDSETSERNFVKFYTARQKTGKDRYSTQSGTADVMVQVPDPKLSTERKPQGTQITTTANRGAEKVFEPYVTKSKASKSKASSRPLPSRQGTGAAPETSMSDLKLPLKGVTKKYISRDLTQAQRQAQAQQELEAQAQYTQTAAELEKEVDKQNKKVSKVEQEVSQASVPINPETGEAILRQYRKNVEAHMASDPTSPTATVNNQRRQSANDKLNVAISNRDTAVSNQQAHLSTPPTPVQTQPTQPAPEQQPVQTQPTKPAPVQTQQAPEQQPVQTQPAPEQQPVKSKAKQEPYKPNAIDRDGDGLVQDGTPHERPAQPTQEPKKKKNTGEKMAAAYDKKVDELVKT